MKVFSKIPTRKLSIFIVVFLLLLICYLISTSTAQSFGQTIVKVDPSTISVDKGEECKVNITVIDVQNLYGVEVVVRWNASLLRLRSVDIRVGVKSHPDGILYEPFINGENKTDGEYLIWATSCNPAPPFNGSGNVIRMTFQAIDDGESIIDLETKLYDYPPPDREPRVSQPIPHTTLDGKITIIPEFSDTTIFVTFLTLATVMLILTIRNRKRVDFIKNQTNIHGKVSNLISEFQ